MGEKVLHIQGQLDKSRTALRKPKQQNAQFKEDTEKAIRDQIKQEYKVRNRELEQALAEAQALYWKLHILSVQAGEQKGWFGDWFGTTEPTIPIYDNRRAAGQEVTQVTQPTRSDDEFNLDEFDD